MKIQIWRCAQCGTDRVWGNTVQPQAVFTVCNECGNEEMKVPTYMLICQVCSTLPQLLPTKHKFVRMGDRVQTRRFPSEKELDKGSGFKL